MSFVTVVGAGGHVGLPFSLVVANSGHFVFGLDVNTQVLEQLRKGFLPYIEEHGQSYLDNALKDDTIQFTNDTTCISESNVVAIMIGTPVDSENNPRLDDILHFVEYTLCDEMVSGTTIILRSTVAPGTTEVIKKLIEKTRDWKEGKDFYLVFAPERVAQGVGITESSKFPQLIGAFSDKSYQMAKDFFDTFVYECIQLTPREAEMAKLMTNMYRYVNFALANEFYMIGTDQGVDVHKIIRAANKDYPRLNIPLPGPNVGGPCLFKDGKFLLSDVPYADLIQTSFLINEGMPEYMFKQILSLNPTVSKIAIMGATFKANCDDERNSLSFKFAKICKRHGIEYSFFDPYIKHPDNVWPTNDIDSYDAYVIMTPHSVFHKFFETYMNRIEGGTVIADAWKFLDRSKDTRSGIYLV
jgi:UDP-N-acetyl-D-mannosaminuronic acid dehydrogenase